MNNLQALLYVLNRNKLAILGVLTAVLVGIEAGESLLSVVIIAVTLLQRQLVTPANEVVLTTGDVEPGSTIIVKSPTPEAPDVEVPGVDDRSFI